MIVLPIENCDTELLYEFIFAVVCVFIFLYITFLGTSVAAVDVLFSVKLVMSEL